MDGDIKSAIQKHHGGCPHDCPDTCSMLVTRNDKTGKAVSVQGDPSHPITKGYLCNKVNHYIDLVYNENRFGYHLCAFFLVWQLLDLFFISLGCARYGVFGTRP